MGRFHHGNTLAGGPLGVERECRLARSPGTGPVAGAPRRSGDKTPPSAAVVAVVCATPDDSHAFVSIGAMPLGKHVYSEKPLRHSVSEVRQMAKVPKETGVATQIGIQGHSGAGIRMTCEWIWNGAIGSGRRTTSRP